ncbi:MAG: hypothetical protein WDZ35_00320 [Crocinitomicaceae bacterium]
MQIISQGKLYDQSKIRFSSLIIGLSSCLIIFGGLLFSSYFTTGFLLICSGIVGFFYLTHLILNAAVLKWEISERGELRLITPKQDFLMKPPVNIEYGYQKHHIKGMIYQYTLLVICTPSSYEDPLILIEELPAGRTVPENWSELQEIPDKHSLYGNSNGLMLKKVALSKMVELIPSAQNIYHQT